MSRTTTSPDAVLRVIGAEHRTFGAGSTRIDDAGERRYLRDQARLGGLVYRPETVENGAGNTFEDMAHEVLDAFAAGPGPVDLLVLSYATPDVRPIALTAALLTPRIQGDPVILGVTDQGRTAPFTMLSLMRSYVRRHGFRRALGMAFDQSFLPYDIPRSGPHHVAGDRAVALLLESAPPAGSPGECEVRQASGVDPHEAPRLLAELAADLMPPRGACLLLGPGVGDGWRLPGKPATVRRVPEGFPCTALLGGLVEQLRAAGPGPILLADYDEETGDLSVCRVEQAAA
ncbi:hypothetical protein [Streptomyces hokutonensis]|uniref:hypothetical protein n=1 Tax=Streptomyces hokutonensis TaxID=1306990 RepID=UPI003406B1EC